MQEENEFVDETKAIGERINDAFQNYWDGLIDRLPEVTVGLLMLLIFIFIGSLIRSLFQRRIAKRAEDPLMANFIGRMIFLLFLLLGIVVFMGQLGLTRVAGGLLAGAGVSALILGFAFRDIGENLLSGVFLAFGRPFRVGDIIEISSYQGRVKGLSLRTTHIRTFDGRDIFVPNGQVIKNPLVNYTRDGLMRHEFTLGLDYGDDLAMAQEVILSTLRANKKISQEANLEPFVILDEFATSTINLRIFFWLNTYDIIISGVVLKSQVMAEVFNALVKAGLNMPADIIELKIYQENQPIPVAVKEVSKFTLQAPPDQKG